MCASRYNAHAAFADRQQQPHKRSREQASLQSDSNSTSAESESDGEYQPAPAATARRHMKKNYKKRSGGSSKKVIAGGDSEWRLECIMAGLLSQPNHYVILHNPNLIKEDFNYDFWIRIAVNTRTGEHRAFCADLFRGYGMTDSGYKYHISPCDGTYKRSASKIRIGGEFNNSIWSYGYTDLLLHIASFKTARSTNKFTHPNNAVPRAFTQHIASYFAAHQGDHSVPMRADGDEAEVVVPAASVPKQPKKRRSKQVKKFKNAADMPAPTPTSAPIAIPTYFPEVTKPSHTQGRLTNYLTSVKHCEFKEEIVQDSDDVGTEAEEEDDGDDEMKEAPELPTAQSPILAVNMMQADAHLAYQFNQNMGMRRAGLMRPSSVVNADEQLAMDINVAYQRSLTAQYLEPRKYMDGELGNETEPEDNMDEEDEEIEQVTTSQSPSSHSTLASPFPQLTSTSWSPSFESMPELSSGSSSGSNTSYSSFDSSYRTSPLPIMNQQTFAAATNILPHTTTHQPHAYRFPDSSDSESSDHLLSPFLH